MTSKPLPTQTTRREEFSYIFMILEEIVRMFIENLTKRRKDVNIKTNQ
jgi:hypothetical protein